MTLKCRFYSRPLELYAAMLKDIKSAKKSVYLETYIFHDDPIGKMFHDALLEKSIQGLDIRILVDSWGSNISKKYFSDLEAFGGDVRFFKEIKLRMNLIMRTHHRDHRKLLVIDERVTYIGSSNITYKCIHWWESNLRIEGEISKKFSYTYLMNAKLYKARVFLKKHHTFPIVDNGMEIIRDVPAVLQQNIKKKIISMIDTAESQVVIETAYFIPDGQLRQSLLHAAKRGVEVMVILSGKSDVRIVDILREKYLGHFHKRNIRMHYYRPGVLHSKVMLVDKKRYCIGSANFDSRSFRHQYEICLFGAHERIAALISDHIKGTLEHSTAFNFTKWKNRSIFHIAIERLLHRFRRYM